MCDYCGCRTRHLIADLGEAHARISAMIASIRAALDRGEPSDELRDALEAVLAPHSELEETGLYVELAAIGLDTERLATEHHHVDQALAGHDPDQVRHALDVLATHIHIEEFDLFPAAHQLLDDEAWDRLDEHHHAWQHRHGRAHHHPG